MTNAIQTMIDRLKDFLQAETVANIDMNHVDQDLLSTIPSKLFLRQVTSYAESCCVIRCYGLEAGQLHQSSTLNSDHILNEAANKD